MVQKSRYIKTKSDYTLRSKHKLLGKGTVYEHDYMTISPMEDLFAKDEYVLKDSNFKFSTRTGINLQKKHKRGNWIPNGVCEGDMEVVWTTECMGSGVTSDEGKIVLKPDYNSIKQFAYYGGAVQLVKASINDVILHFPGEIYLTNDSLTLTELYKEQGETFVKDVPVSGLKYAKNDYNINIDITNVNSNEIYNPMRFFCLHAYDYVVESADGSIEPVTSWTVTSYSGDTCDDNFVVADVEINGIHFKVYRDNNTQQRRIGYSGNYSGTSIHPNQDVIEAYFASIDDFEKVLLNRDTNPIYTAKFITPRETDTGFTYMLKYYTWPVTYGYSPELETIAFDIYYKSLIQLAEFHDEWDSDNIWRSMTHEAIKNLDWTFIRHTEDGLEDLSVIDNSKIIPVLKIWGRNFDDIKRFIDNIKACNTVSYNGKNNIPDYFLTDMLEMGGWETKVLHLGAYYDERTPSLYPALSRGYNSSDADIEFFRRLKLNSKYILRSKGTRESIQQVLGLFGITSDEYKITEYVAVAQPNGNYATGFSISTSDEGPSVTYPLASEVEAINKTRTGFYGRHGNDGFAGIPINVVSVSNDSSSGVTSYVVPWYRNGYDYDGGLYFQMNGGWFASDDKEINLAISPDIDKIYSDDNITIYDETESYLHFTDDIDGLKDLSTEDKKTNDVCYVTDIALVSDDYNFKDDTERTSYTNNEFSHYFILENQELSFVIGYSSENESYGWRNILLSEIEENSSSAGTKVLYLESIESNTAGNNPHIGHGRYDGGAEYLRRMGQIFHYGLENGEFGAYDEATCQEIANYGFNIESGIEDDKKCWYYGDVEGLMCVEKTADGDTNFEECDGPAYETQAYAYNPEGGESSDEPAANSVINVKNVEMEFYCPDTLNDSFKADYKRFIENVVLFYLKQIIPSTTILKYTILCSGDDGGFLSVSPSQLFFPSGDNTPKTFTVTAKQQGWTLNGKPSWLNIEPTSGPEGKTTVTVTPVGSAGDKERVAELTVNGTKSGQKKLLIAQAGAQPSPTYKVEIKRVDGKPVNACPPYDAKAILYTYSSSAQNESTLVSEENVTADCTWVWKRNTPSPACKNQETRTTGTLIGSGENAIFRFELIPDAPSSMACPSDEWCVTYNKNGISAHECFYIKIQRC